MKRGAFLECKVRRKNSTINSKIDNEGDSFSSQPA